MAIKYRNKETGVVLAPTNEFVIKELEKQKDKYEIVKEKKDPKDPKDPKGNEGTENK